RLALCRARVVRGDPAFAEEVTRAVRDALLGHGWQPEVVDEARAMRQKLEATAGPRSLKRGPGGLADVEFAVQVLQLKHGRDRPEILTPNVWDALDALAAGRILPAEESSALRDGYTFLRLVEARLRVVTDRPLTELPDAPDGVAKLAFRLGFAAPADFLAEFRQTTARTRAVYHALTARERDRA
ncbi:MAG: bifunctional [glutamate--ammonia ligase]-adenylyl-L-tyrosine phosphorylase/[glutamate--ammonia-ligase] adenylyltransferase, partial [Gemmataceae bacterium]|nr:bifunctional [glutamate--ammonia ligase]-adenylyl-L-tyrosine phosphorylase/[glutamate--ammonia-ligase] adenylyltransferase [Gemmataceae bacterium]